MGGVSAPVLMTGRVYQAGRWYRYEAQLPSGAGWHSKGYYTAAGASAALKAAMKRRLAAVTPATGESA